MSQQRIAHTLCVKQPYHIDSLIYSFYNSLTLAFAELQGRYYGGGVLELTPNEFKNLPVPYVPLKEGQFENYASSFKAKKSIQDICKEHDRKILKSFDDGLDDDNIEKLSAIREKLFLRRIKKG